MLGQNGVNPSYSPIHCTASAKFQAANRRLLAVRTMADREPPAQRDSLRLGRWFKARRAQRHDWRDRQHLLRASRVRRHGFSYASPAARRFVRRCGGQHWQLYGARICRLPRPFDRD